MRGGAFGAAGRRTHGGPDLADAGVGPTRAWAGWSRAGRAGAVCSRPRGAARCPRRETGGRWAGSPARARARLSPPARWSGCWRGAARLGRRRPGTGERAEQRTVPRLPQAPGSRRSAPDSSGPAAARAFQWAARTCSTRACRSVRPRARISGRGGGAAGGAAALCASARARRRARAAGLGAGPGRGAPSACACCCVGVRVRRCRPPPATAQVTQRGAGARSSSPRPSRPRQPDPVIHSPGLSGSLIPAFPDLRCLHPSGLRPRVPVSGPQTLDPTPRPWVSAPQASDLRSRCPGPQT